MSLTVIMVIVLSILLNMPAIKHQNIGSWKVKNVLMPAYILLVAVLTALHLFTGISDSLLVALSFVYLMSQEMEVIVIEYVYCTITLLLVAVAFFVNIPAIWVSFALLALIAFNHNRSNFLFPIMALALAIAPGVQLIQMLYIQWGALLMIPALIGIISSRQSRDKFTFSGLILLLISSTRFYSLGYSSILILGLALVLFFVKDYHNKKAFLYTMGLIPFVGIYDPFNIISIYISINVILLYKIELLKIVDGLETQGGTIKNIKYQEIFILALGIYIIAGGPGSPMNLMVEYSLKQKDLFCFFILLDFIEINKTSVENAIEQSGQKINPKGIHELSSILYMVLMCIIYRDSIFGFSYTSLIIIGVFIVVLIIYKKKKAWLLFFLEMKDVFAVTCTKTRRSPVEECLTLKTERKSAVSGLSLAEVDEGIIWSIFIFVVSSLLIWRYL